MQLYPGEPTGNLAASGDAFRLDERAGFGSVSDRLLLAYLDKPILLLWDRAPWHKGSAIRSVLAANPRLEILVGNLVVSAGLPGVEPTGTRLEGNSGSGQPQPSVCQTADTRDGV